MTSSPDGAGRTSPEPHVASVAFEAPFDDVWDACADPLRSPELYPNRIAEIAQTGDGQYRAVTPEGAEFTLLPSLNYADGIIDYTVVLPDGATEHQRSRLFPLDDRSCVLVHLAVRLADRSDADWDALRDAVDEDLRNARRIVGQHPRTETTAE